MCGEEKVCDVEETWEHVLGECRVREEGES